MNKGTAFNAEERDEFKLSGLLPSAIDSLEDQVKRAYAQYRSKPDDLGKNTFMTSLKEQNEVLYYKVVFCPYQLFTFPVSPLFLCFFIHCLKLGSIC